MGTCSSMSATSVTKMERTPFPEKPATGSKTANPTSASSRPLIELPTKDSQIRVVAKPTSDGHGPKAGVDQQRESLSTLPPPYCAIHNPNPIPTSNGPPVLATVLETSHTPLAGAIARMSIREPSRSSELSPAALARKSHGMGIDATMVCITCSKEKTALMCAICLLTITIPYPPPPVGIYI